MVNLEELKKDKTELEKSVTALVTDFINKHGGSGNCRLRADEKRMNLMDKDGNILVENAEIPFFHFELIIKL